VLIFLKVWYNKWQWTALIGSIRWTCTWKLFETSTSRSSTHPYNWEGDLISANLTETRRTNISWFWGAHFFLPLFLFNRHNQVMSSHEDKEELEIILLKDNVNHIWVSGNFQISVHGGPHIKVFYYRTCHKLLLKSIL
jgi:hypothetical protein